MSDFPLSTTCAVLLILLPIVGITANSKVNIDKVSAKERAYVAAFRANCPGFVIENFEITEDGTRITSLKCTNLSKD